MTALTRKHVIHVIANCRTPGCDWDCDDMRTAESKAIAHANKHDHVVSVEVGLGITYRKAKPKVARQ